jgi:hypothetical protein
VNSGRGRGTFCGGGGGGWRTGFASCDVAGYGWVGGRWDYAERLKGGRLELDLVLFLVSFFLFSCGRKPMADFRGGGRERDGYCWNTCHDDVGSCDERVWMEISGINTLVEKWIELLCTSVPQLEQENDWWQT